MTTRDLPRFLEKVELIPFSAHYESGYGRFWIGGIVPAHRASFDRCSPGARVSR